MCDYLEVKAQNELKKISEPFDRLGASFRKYKHGTETDADNEGKQTSGRAERQPDSQTAG